VARLQSCQWSSGGGIWEEGMIFPLAFSTALNTALWRQERIFQFLTAFSGYRLSADVFKNVGSSAMSPLSMTALFP